MNIKNIICLFLCFCTVFVFCACGNGSDSDKTAEGGTASVTTADGQNSGTAKEDGGIDVDLTALSSTMETRTTSVSA